MSDLFWLTDEQMARLQPFFPRSHGRPRVDDHRVLSGIIFINRNGLRWRDAPRESQVIFLGQIFPRSCHRPLEPQFSSFPVRHNPPEELIKCGSMVGLGNVAKLMGDDIVDGVDRGLDQSPI